MKSLITAAGGPTRGLLIRSTLLGLLGLGVALGAPRADADPDDRHRQFLLPPPVVSTTIPPNGDVNPYGVAFVPPGFPSTTVEPGDILVANFNDAANLQGTGTTIVSVPGGVPGANPATVFFQGTAPLGLTGALAVLKSGLVLVGNVPADANGLPEQGSLLVIDANGNLVETLVDADFLNGPWGLAVHEEGRQVQLFVSNVNRGTVSRLDASVDRGSLSIHHRTRIASGYQHAPNPGAFVLGPSGLAYDAHRDVLYVANSDSNQIFAVENAGHRSSNGGTGTVIFADLTHLHGPLDLVLAPNGHLITANSDGSNADPAQPSEIVEFTVGGKFIFQFPIDPNNGGAFGIAIGPSPLGDDFFRFAAVDDNNDTLTVFTEVGPCGL